MLSNGVELEFSALQPHQQHAWYAFLVQLAALALHRTKRSVEPLSFGAWEESLLTLTDGQSEPFTLCVEDLSKAAFMQCPVPEKSIATWKTFSCPDTLDVLISAKNHDIKMERMANPRTEHWAYMLVSVQTMQGFWGRGHYGIARMNSGIGSRSCASIGPGLTLGKRFCRDVGIWLEQRPTIQKMVSGSLALCWLDPWNGKSAPLALKQVDPFFIEACSRIRMQASEDRLTACSTHVEQPHVLAPKGVTGEIWTPIRVEDEAVLSLKQNPFEYNNLCTLLFKPEWRLPAALIPGEEEMLNPTILFQGLSRAQGKTEGYYERVLTPSSEAVQALQTSQARAQFAEVAQTLLDAAQTVRFRILKPALLSMIQGGPNRIKMDDGRVDSELREFHQWIDSAFFAALFSSPTDQRLAGWVHSLLTSAQQVLLRAAQSLPIPAARRDYALAMAFRIFQGGAASHFPDHSIDLEFRLSKNPIYLRRRKVVQLLANFLESQVSAQDVAWLRRLNPGDTQAPAFQMLYRRFLNPRVPEYPATDRKWAVIVRAMAELVGLHRPTRRLGRVLSQTGFSSARVGSLLSARGVVLEAEVYRLSRWLTQHATGVHQMEIVDLVLSDHDEVEPLEDSSLQFRPVREKIAQDFYSSI